VVQFPYLLIAGRAELVGLPIRQSFFAAVLFWASSSIPKTLLCVLLLQIDADPLDCLTLPAFLSQQ
jgi:hypothetical protein